MLATIKVFGRMAYGSDIGFSGKFADVSRTDGAKDQDSLHTGTIAVVERKEVDGKTLAIKRLRDGSSEAVAEDAQALRAMASVGFQCGLQGAAALTGIATDLLRELDLVRECRRTHMLRETLARDRYTQLQVSAPVPVDTLSSDSQFVYEYTHGDVLNSGHDQKIIERFVIAYFMLLHLDGIVLMDPRRQNVIVEKDTNNIVLIDAGATRRMTIAEYQHKTKLHLCGLDRMKIWKELGGAGVSAKLVEVVHSFCQPFWDRDAEFPSVDIIQEFLRTPSLLAEQVDPAISAVTRSMLTLCHTLAELGCKKIDVQDVMCDIKKQLTAAAGANGESDPGEGQ